MSKPATKPVIYLGTKSGVGGLPFCVPLDLATESIAIIARKGAGKTHTARVISEDLLVNHIQTVVIDPLDVWWGLRLSLDGKRAGENVIIFGGSHADLPLTEHLGKTLADLIVDRGINAVLVLDQLSMAAQRRFVAAFCERLFERKSEQQHRTPLHLIVDEADSFAPQRPPPDAMPCLGAVDRLVRRGRSRGIGTTAISQRPAVLSKDVLTQTEVLITLQVVSPQDRDAVTEWIRANADPKEAKTFLDSLAGLPRGDAWIWSPSRLKVLERIHIRQARTYDSSYTPKVGEKRAEPPRLKPVDLDKLRGMLQSVVTEAEANDPKKLRLRIRELEAQVKAAPAAASKDALQRSFEEGFAKAEAAHRKKRAAWSKRLEEQARAIAYIQGEIEPGTVVDIPEAARRVETAFANARVGQSTVWSTPPPARGSVRERFNRAMSVAQSAVRAPRELAAGGDVKLARAERSIMAVLAQYPDGRTKSQVAIMTGYSHSGGGFNNALSRLRSCGFITEDGGRFALTSSGSQHVAGDTVLAGLAAELPQPGEELVRHWLGQLSKAERAIIEQLHAAYPAPMTKEAVAHAARYEPSGGGFNNALSRLRTLELIRGRDELSLTEALVGNA